MADEVFDGPNMVRQLFGEGEGVPDEAGDALAHCVVETLDVVGFPRVLRNGFVLRRRNDPCVDGILIRIKRRLLPVDRRQIEQLPENLSRKGCAPIIEEPREVI